MFLQWTRKKRERKRERIIPFSQLRIEKLVGEKRAGNGGEMGKGVDRKNKID